MSATQSITSSSTIFSSGIVSPDHLTPDGMVIYLQSRLGSLDEQINTIMNKQNASEGARKALQSIQNEMANVSEEGGTVNVAAFVKSLNEVTAQMGEKAAAELFVNLPEAVRSELVLAAPPKGSPEPSFSSYTLSKNSDASVTLSKQDVTAVKTYVENAIKDVDRVRSSK